MSGWRILFALGLTVVLAATIVAFVSLSVPAMREHPRLGLALSVVVSLACGAGILRVLGGRH